MRISNATPKNCLSLAAVCMSLVLASFAANAAEPSATEQKPYEWSAALISFDDATNTAVFRANVVSHANIDGLDRLKEGDRLILIWSGRAWANGVLDLARDPELTPDALSLPVEFVSSRSDGKYIDFRTYIPESAVETISKMQAGMRVTGTSPRMATDWHNGIVSLRAYNDVD